MKNKPTIIWGHIIEHSKEDVIKMKKHGHCPDCTYKFLKDGRIKITVHN